MVPIDAKFDHQPLLRNAAVWWPAGILTRRFVHLLQGVVR
jgi:hypothetical protein